MLKKTKFFDVECAFGRAYDLKELRRILDKAIREKVKKLQVVRMGRHTVRAVVELHDHTEVYFKEIQKEELDGLGIELIEVMADGTGVSLRTDPETVVSSAIPTSFVPVSEVPVTIEVIKRHPAAKPRRQTRRTIRSRPAAA